MVVFVSHLHFVKFLFGHHFTMIIVDYPYYIWKQKFDIAIVMVHGPSPDQDGD